MWKKLSALAFGAVLSLSAIDANAAIAEQSFSLPADIVAVKLGQQLSERHFKIIDNLNVLPRIHKGNPKLAAQIPSDIQAERLLVVCQSRSVVAFLRTDPAATSLCPITISLVQKNGKTTAYYLQRAPLLSGAAKAIGQKVDDGVLDALHTVETQLATPPSQAKKGE